MPCEGAPELVAPVATPSSKSCEAAAEGGAVLDAEALRIEIKRLPDREDVTLDVDIDKVIALLSR